MSKKRDRYKGRENREKEGPRKRTSEGECEREKERQKARRVTGERSENDTLVSI